MNIKTLDKIPTWEWPEEAHDMLVRALRDGECDPADRPLAARLAGDAAVISDELAGILLGLIGDGGAPEELRVEAAIAFGPALELGDIDGFDDPDDVPISEKTFRTVQDSMRQLYNDGEVWHFMHPENYEQYTADAAAVGDAVKWIKEQDICTVTLWNGTPLSIEPPNFVVLKITETDPGLKGDTSGGGGKPATLETGAVVRVPLFVQVGETVKVDTRSGEYVSRVKEE